MIELRSGFSIFFNENGWLGGADGRGTLEDGTHMDPCSLSVLTAVWRWEEDDDDVLVVMEERWCGRV